MIFWEVFKSQMILEDIKKKYISPLNFVLMLEH